MQHREEDPMANGIQLVAHALRGDPISDDELNSATPFIQDGLHRILSLTSREARYKEFYNWAAESKHPKTGESLELEMIERVWFAGLQLSNAPSKRRYPFGEDPTQRLTMTSPSVASPRKCSTTQGSDTSA